MHESYIMKPQTALTIGPQKVAKKKKKKQTKQTPYTPHTPHTLYTCSIF